MTALSDDVGDYLSVRRAMGCKLERAEELLTQFVRHLEEVGVTTVTVDQALAWVTMPVGVSRAWTGIRLSTVRSFASWLQARDPATEVPPPDVLGPSRSAEPSPTCTPTQAGLHQPGQGLRPDVGGDHRAVCSAG